MKIAILSFYSGLRERGVEHYAENLALKLGQKYKIIVYQSGNQKTNNNYRKIIIPTKFSFEHQPPKLLRKFYLDYYSLKTLIFTVKVLRHLVREKPDILLPTNNGWQSLICKIYSLIFKIPLILAGHAGIGADDRFNLILNPSVFICFSRTQAEWARQVNKNIRIEIIPHGVDLKVFNQNTKPAQVGLAKPIILCVSSLDAYKRIELLIKAVGVLKKGSLLLICHGNSREKEKIKKLAQEKLKKRFKLIETTYEQLPSFYATASLFSLVSSSQEAFGIVYLEAMACGLPVVATDDKLRREIIAQAGIFVKNPEDINDYAHCLEVALKTNFKEIPRKQAEKFSWNKMANEYEKLFLELKK